MTAALTWEKRNDVLALTGELDRDTLMSFWTVRQAQMDSVRTVDVSGLAHVDSAGLAMLVRLKSEQGDTPLTLSGVSPNLQMLISLYGVASEFSDNQQ